MNQPGHPPRLPAKRWVMLGFLLLICFVSHFNRASVTNAGDERIMKQYSISPERMGLVYSSFLIVYTVFMIPGGWLIDRRGPKFALVLMVGGSAIFCACTGAIGLGFIPLAGVWLALLLVRAAMGLCSTPLHPGAARSIGQWFPAREAAWANGIITGASILAYAVVHTIFGKLIDWFDWPIAFLCTGAATFALAIAWWWFGSDGPFQHQASGSDETGVQSSAAYIAAPSGHPAAPIPVLPYVTASLPAPWPVRELVCLTASYAAVGYFQYLFFYWLHFYFDDVLKMGKMESRFFAGLPSLVMAAAMPIGGWLMGRMEMRFGRGRRFLFPLITMLASAACLLAGVKAQNLHWVVTWFTAALGLLGLCESAFWITAIELGGKRGGTSAAIMNTGGNGIGLLAPALTPVISRHFGWSGGLCAGAFVAVVGALCWLGIRRTPAASFSRETVGDRRNV